MTPEQARTVRDQALRDLVELAQQQAEGEVTAPDADRLRRRYEAEAAAALRALDHGEPAGSGGGVRVGRAGSGRARRAAYVATALAAVVAATVLLPRSLLDRPAGGYVTGNELGGTAPAAAPAPPAAAGRDLASVTEAELEAVVDANPDVLGMRLALANRYVEKGNLAAALPHFVEVLRREPENARAQAYLGWGYLVADQPEKARRYIETARQLDPALLDAQWFEANLLLYGTDDPAGALRVLTGLAARTDLPPEVAGQVRELTAVAQAELDGAGGPR